MGERVEQRRGGRRSAAESEQTRAEVIDAALRVFADKGFEAASLRDIAALADTAHGLIRHHFGSKEGVWRAAVDVAVARSIAALMPSMTRAADSSTNPADEARRAIRAMLDVSRRQPEIARMLLHEGVRGGSHLIYALEQYVAIGDVMEPLFKRLHTQGRLMAFDNRTLFLFILTAGIGPLALPALSA